MESIFKMNRTQLLVSLCAIFIPQLVFAQAPKIPPVVKLGQVQPKRAVFQDATREKPLILLNAKSALKYFDKDAMEKIDQKIDFKQQVLMVFAWRGSGQDELRYSLLESYPEQLRFQYIGGRTRDFREHTAVFAVRSNVIWKGKPIRPAEMTNGEDYIKVEVQGKLSRVFAIGGETTGYQIAAKGINWELDFGGNKKSMTMANALDGKQVVVKGQLYSKQGVEIRLRRIVKVESFQASGGSAVQ